MFYDKFQTLCKKKGISISRAATEIGLSNSTPTKWKKTKATPDSSTLEKISAYFQVPINLLLSDPASDKSISFTTTVEELREYIDIKKAPTPESEHQVSDEDIKFALWGDTNDITEEDLEDVKRYAAFIRERKRKDD